MCFQNQAATYSGKIKNLLSRAYNEPGFTNDQKKDATSFLRGEGVRGVNDIARKILEEEFQDNYKTRGNILESLTKETLDKDTLKNELDLYDLSREFGLNQKRQDRELAGVFSKLGDAKGLRESALINTLDRFGNQQHIYDEIADAGNKKVFDIESYLPYSKLNNLKTAVSNTKLEPGNPNSEKQARDMINKALLDYGIAGVGGNNNNFAAWDKNRVTDKPVLIDNLTEELPEKILESQYSLQRLNPKFRSDLYNQKKDIEKDLYGSKVSLAQDLQNKTLANAAYNNAMKVAPGELKLLDSHLKEAMEQQMNRIANKYIRLGQYGSPQNIRESEKMADQLTREYAEKRSSIFNKRLQQEELLERNRNLEQRSLLDDISKQENKQFDNILERITETNNIGSQNWNNLQAAKNQKTNQHLNNLKFAESIPSLGGRLTEFINPTHEANFNARTQNYLNKKPLSGLSSPESLNLNNINRIANFNESDKASDPYVNATNNTLQNYFQYDPMAKEDALQAAGKYKSHKKVASDRKKQIEETAEKGRREALAKAAENTRDLSGESFFKLKGLLDASTNDELANQINVWDKIANLIEDKTKYRFKFNPQYGRGHTTSRNVYDPAERKYIQKIAQQILSQA